MPDTLTSNQSSKKSPLISHTILHAIKEGLLVTLPMSPVLNALNNMSVVGGRNRLDFLGSFTKVYHGVDGSQHQSWCNFTRGLGSHGLKEAVRQVYRAPGNYVLRPYIESQISNPTSSAFVWTLSMMAADAVFQPLDTIRVCKQSGDPIVLNRLYAGSIPNGVRHFTQHFLYAHLNNQFKGYLQQAGIDPFGIKSALIQTVPLSFCVTGVLFPIERLKNEKQYSSISGSNYVQIAKELLKAQGIKGVYQGFTAKLLSNCVQTFFTLALYNKAKRERGIEPLETSAAPT